VTEQASDTEAGVVDAVTLLPGVPHAEEHNPGRPMSWVGVAIVVVGFIIGGIAFFPAPHWTIFWIGTGVAIVGCLVLLFTKTMNEDWY
jgi:protein-S-isoprenylcysteine O-methyltransferase Ste14